MKFELRKDGRMGAFAYLSSTKRAIFRIAEEDGLYVPEVQVTGYERDIRYRVSSGEATMDLAIELCRMEADHLKWMVMEDVAL